MSTDYFASIAVGFEVTSAALTALKIVHPEQSHAEKRYDPKLGTRVGDEEVVDSPEHVVIRYNGDEYPSFEEFCREVAQEINCDVHVWGEDWDEPTDGRAIFGPTLEENEDSQHPHPHFDVGGSVDYDNLMRAAGEIARIKKELELRGIPVGRPIVGLVCRFG